MFRWLRGLLAATTTVGASAVLATASAAALPPGCSQSGVTVTCTYTSGSNPFTMPAGVSSIHVAAVGGMGGGTGGVHGANVTGDVSVAPGSTLFAVVGGDGGAPTSGGITGGTPGTNGGGHGAPPGFCVTDPALCMGIRDFTPFSRGGGGASDVRTSQNDLSTRLLVAAGSGGSGGGGETSSSGPIAPGGAGGSGGGGDGSSADGGDGHGGAGGAGGAGGVGQTTCQTLFCETGANGAPGRLGVGGDGGDGGNEFFRPVLLLIGGAGGGGGGGLFGGGGGGGGVSGGGGGGGGGSNLVPPGGSQSIDATGTPMVQTSYRLVPTSKVQCKDGGWRNFPQFKNQGDCVSFVETGK